MTRLSEADDQGMAFVMDDSGVLCEHCGSRGHNTAGHSKSVSRGALSTPRNGPIGPNKADA